MSSPEMVRPAMAPVCQLVRETRVWPTDLVGDLGVLEWLGMVRLWRVGQERPAVLSRLAAVLEAPDPDFAIVTPVARARSRLITRRHVRAGVIATQVLPIVDVVRLVERGRVLDLVPCTVDVHLLLG